MGSQPNHHDVLTVLLNLCTNAITECEAELEQQKALDMVEAKRLKEEQKARENEARMLAEQQEKERREKIEKMEKDRLEIEAAERDLVAKKEALWNAQKGPDDDEEDEEEEEGSESSAEEHLVSLSVSIFALFYTILINNYVRTLVRQKPSASASLRRKLAKRLPRPLTAW